MQTRDRTPGSGSAVRRFLLVLGTGKQNLSFPVSGTLAFIPVSRIIRTEHSPALSAGGVFCSSERFSPGSKEQVLQISNGWLQKTSEIFPEESWKILSGLKKSLNVTKTGECGCPVPGDRHTGIIWLNSLRTYIGNGIPPERCRQFV